MALDWSIYSVAFNPRFWTDYFWLTRISAELGYAELVNYEVLLTEQESTELQKYGVDRDNWQYCRLTYPVGDEYSLILQFDPCIDEVDLTLCKRDSSCKRIAWDDQAHPYPEALRWEELDLICKCVALCDPSLPHPGLPLLLLCRFAPITDSDQADSTLPLLWEAWHSLNLFSDQEIEKFISLVDRRGHGFEWKRDNQHGWIMHQESRHQNQGPLYTLRFSESLEFPFTEFEGMMEVARSICNELPNTALNRNEDRY